MANNVFEQNFEEPLLENNRMDDHALVRTYYSDHPKFNAKNRIEIYKTVLEIWHRPGRTFFALTR